MTQRELVAGHENTPHSTPRKTVHPETAHADTVATRFASLQGAIGNQAVQALVKRGKLQTKLSVSRPGDRHEREADRVADEVMRKPTPTSDEATTGERVQQASDGRGRSRGDERGAPTPVSSSRGGTPLSPSTRAFFEPRFDRDFSAVRTHTGPDSVRINRVLGARAFTHGRDIYFGAGEYDPRSVRGKHLIAHELTHTVQQGVSDGIRDPQLGVADSATAVTPTLGPAIQRLIKADDAHPWTGIVIGTPLLALRATPGMEGSTIADLPRDTLVDVLRAQGQWLALEVNTSQEGVVLNSMGRERLTGNDLEGFSYHEYIDDAVAAGMTSMLGEEAAWRGSGPGSGTDFETWASAPSEREAPPLERTTVINCWEMILLAAYRIGAVDWQWIHDLYTDTTGDWATLLVNTMTSGSRTEYTEDTADDLERGDVVFFNGAAHVTLATGRGDEVLTFWPPPNTEFTFPGATVDEVKTSTISELKAWMEAYFGPTTVTFGSPGW